MNNEKIFLQELELGNFKTNLTEKKMEEIKSILNRYKTSKKFGLGPDRNRTVETLTVETLELHNKKIEEEGSNTLDFDNECDEEPLGRGNSLRDIIRKQRSYTPLKTRQKIEETNAQLEDRRKFIENVTKLSKAHIVSATKSTEVETPPEQTSSLLLKRKLMLAKQSQKKETPKQELLQDLFLDTKSSLVGSEKDNFLESKNEKEPQHNISHEINDEEWKVPNKRYSDDVASFKHDDKIGEPSNAKVHVEVGKENVRSCEIVKKRKYTKFKDDLKTLTLINILFMYYTVKSAFVSVLFSMVNL